MNNKFKFAVPIFGLVQKITAEEIIKCNDYTAQFGLVLTPTQALDIAENKSFVLKENGRIEIGNGIIDKLIKEFCDSPYISMYNYQETINALVEMFYYYKNETLDVLSDDELLKYMETAYNGVCQGSLELLRSRELDKIARNIRFGHDALYNEEEANEEDEDEIDE